MQPSACRSGWRRRPRARPVHGADVFVAGTGRGDHEHRAGRRGGRRSAGAPVRPPPLRRRPRRPRSAATRLSRSSTRAASARPAARCPAASCVRDRAGADDQTEQQGEDRTRPARAARWRTPVTSCRRCRARLHSVDGRRSATGRPTVSSPARTAVATMPASSTTSSSQSGQVRAGRRCRAATAVGVDEAVAHREPGEEGAGHVGAAAVDEVGQRDRGCQPTPTISAGSWASTSSSAASSAEPDTGKTTVRAPAPACSSPVPAAGSSPSRSARTTSSAPQVRACSTTSRGSPTTRCGRARPPAGRRRPRRRRRAPARWLRIQRAQALQVLSAAVARVTTTTTGRPSMAVATPGTPLPSSSRSRSRRRCSVVASANASSWAPARRGPAPSRGGPTRASGARRGHDRVVAAVERVAVEPQPVAVVDQAHAPRGRPGRAPARRRSTRTSGPRLG